MQKLKLQPAIALIDELNRACESNTKMLLPITIPPYIAFDGKSGEDYARNALTIGELPNAKMRMAATRAAARVFGVEKVEYGVPIFKTLGLTRTEAFEVCKSGKLWILSTGEDIKLAMFWKQASDPYPLPKPADTYNTLVGDMPIREHVKNELMSMTDRELIDAILAPTCADPELMGEAIHRKLIWRGASNEEIYATVEARESKLELLLRHYDESGESTHELAVVTSLEDAREVWNEHCTKLTEYDQLVLGGEVFHNRKAVAIFSNCGKCWEPGYYTPPLPTRFTDTEIEVLCY